MRDSTKFALLTAGGSALCWLPIIQSPNLQLPAWCPLIALAPLCAIATVLFGERWWRIVLAASVGTFGGLVAGFIFWSPFDSIGAAFFPIPLLIAVALAALVSLLPALILSKIRPTTFGPRRLLWIAFALLLATGPALVAVTPVVVARRVARNDGLAQLRFAALKRAAELAAAQHGGPDRICEDSFVRQNYDGPPFSDDDWRYIAGNYVQQDGYEIGIWCRQQNGYTIDLLPIQKRQYGSKNFCADETGLIGCEAKWVPFREACEPCEM